MSYFKNFPTVSLDVFDNNTEVLLTDITRRVRFSDLVKKNYVQYDYYDIKDQETPEYIASEFYGDPLTLVNPSCK